MSYIKCMSCGESVNPKWKAAISNNQCPMCGDKILLEDVQEKLLSLSEIISSLSDHEEVLNNWMFSNFKFKKIEGHDSDMSEGQKLKSTISPEVFMRNAGAKNKGDDSRIKSIVSNIKNNSLENRDEQNLVIHEEVLDNNLNYEDNFIKSSVSGDESDFFSIEEVSSFNDIDGDGDGNDSINILTKLRSSPDYNPKDAIKLKSLIDRTNSNRSNKVKSFKSNR